jgi:hypothetical protein
VRFNAGQRPPNGSVAQTFGTVPGRRYTITVDVGANSDVNAHEQRLAVSVQGNGELLSATVAVSANRSGLQWTTRSFSFVADGASARLALGDASSVTDSVDLHLDNVRVN